MKYSEDLIKAINKIYLEKIRTIQYIDDYELIDILNSERVKIFNKLQENNYVLDLPIYIDAILKYTLIRIIESEIITDDLYTIFNFFIKFILSQENKK